MICWHLSTAGSQECVRVCLASDAVWKWDATLCCLVIALQTIIHLLSLQLEERSSLGSVKVRCIFSILKSQICKECEYSVAGMSIPF